MLKLIEKIKLLMGAYYVENPIVAQIDEIFKYINDDGEILNEGLDKSTKNFIKEQIGYFREGYTYLEKNRKDIINMTNEDFNKEFDDMIIKFTKEFEIENYTKPKITIVKKFPHPFEDCDYKAMNFTTIQAAKFNVPKGIYLLEKYAIHGISEIMIAHEIMHFIVGEMTKENEQLNQCPFHEEGIVDFMSLYLLMKYHIVEDSCILNHLIFGRGNCNENYIGSLYFKEAKQILWIAKNKGIEKVKEIIRTGQKGLANLSLLDYKKTEEINKDKDLERLIAYYDFVFTNFCVDVDMYYVYNENLNINDGKKIEELRAPFNLSEKLPNIIERLEKMGLMYVLDNKVYNPNAKKIDTMKVRLVL